MSSNCKLTYFQLTALGEGIRFILSYGNIPFEDCRVSKEEWPSLKPKTPFGKVPILEIDGKVIHQSNAIMRYLAKRTGLAGKDDWEALQIDIIADTITDFRLQIGSYYYDTNEASRAAKFEPLMKETIPFFLSRLDKIVEENNGYFVGGKLSWVDLNFIGMSDYMQRLVNMDFFKDYPNLARLKENVVNIPQIKAWIEKRPADAYFTDNK